MTVASVLDSLDWVSDVAGGVWLGLTAIMVFIVVRLRKNRDQFRYTYRLGWILLIAVWAYPLYTGFFSNVLLGEIGNVATLLLTVHYAVKLKVVDRSFSWLMLPQVLWCAVASVYGGLLLAAS